MSSEQPRDSDRGRKPSHSEAGQTPRDPDAGQGPRDPEAGLKQRRVVCSAPGRAGIIGNPTDMYGGAVLSCSVDMRARVTVTSTPLTGSPRLHADQGGRGSDIVLETGGEECRIVSRDDLRPRGDGFDVARAVLDYLHLPPLASGARRARGPDGPFRVPCCLQYESEIPLRSGMAGSTALVVALLQALLVWQGEGAGLYRLAERARYIELNVLKVVCGYQDAYMCTFGGLNYMDFGGKQFYRQAEAELFATVEPLAPYVAQLPFVLGFTGVQHASSAVHKPIRERWLDGEAAVVEGYRRITELARLGKKAIILGDWPLLGRLMNENHAIQRDLGGSGESNERLIAAALDTGALGAKLAGAGDGGTIIALWPWPDVTPLEDALREAGASAIYHPQVASGVTSEVDEQAGTAGGSGERATQDRPRVR
jgi:galactokinase/mevalonate kinase-like predicted kinase